MRDHVAGMSILDCDFLHEWQHQADRDIRRDRTLEVRVILDQAFTQSLQRDLELFGR